MRKIRVAVFVIFCIAFGLLAGFVMSGQLAPSVLIARVVVSAVVLLSAATSVIRLAGWAAEPLVKEYIPASKRQVTTIEECAGLVSDYLSAHESTAFFREELNTINNELRTFSRKIDSIQKLLNERFEDGGLSYSKFISTVNGSRDFVVKMVKSLVARLDAFDETEYENKIRLLRNQSRDASDYEGLQKEHTDYAGRVLESVDAAALRLDRLALELSKLDDADERQMMDILGDMDELINTTVFYK